MSKFKRGSISIALESKVGGDFATEERIDSLNIKLAMVWSGFYAREGWDEKTQLRKNSQDAGVLNRWQSFGGIGPR